MCISSPDRLLCTHRLLHCTRITKGHPRTQRVGNWTHLPVGFQTCVLCSWVTDMNAPSRPKQKSRRHLWLVLLPDPTSNHSQALSIPLWCVPNLPQWCSFHHHLLHGHCHPDHAHQPPNMQIQSAHFASDSSVASAALQIEPLSNSGPDFPPYLKPPHPSPLTPCFKPTVAQRKAIYFFPCGQSTVVPST